MSRNLGVARKIFALAGAGHFTLPAEIVQARATLDNLAAMTVPPPNYREKAKAELAAAIRQAAANGKPFPPIDALVAAGPRDEALQLAHQLHRELLAQHEGDVRALVFDLADTIIGDHIRPPFEAVLAEAAEAVKKAPMLTTGPSEQTLLLAPDPVRKSAAALDRLAASYGALRSARADLALGAADEGVQHDHNGIFASYRNLRELWPGHGTNMAGSPPWPSKPRPHLIWLVTSEPRPDPWMPTFREQDAAYLEAYSDALARSKTARAFAAGGIMIGLGNPVGGDR